VISTHTFPRLCLNYLIYVVVSLLVIAAILLSLVRLALPAIDEYKPDIELWVSGLIGQQIHIATLDAAWYGLEPQLVLKGVQLLSEDRMKTHGYFQQARLGLNIWGSLTQGRFVPGAFTVEGARFVVIRHEDGHISIQGISKTNTSGDQVSFLEDWLFRQRVLDVKESEVVWRDLKTESRSWLFSDVNLRFVNDSDRHLITGAVNLPEELGAKLKVAVDIEGDMLSASGWYGNAYVESASLKLAEWFKDLPVKNIEVTEGELGVRLWSKWSKASLSELSGEIFIKNLQAAAKDEAKIRVIESFSGNLAAQEFNDVWEATLDDIVVSSNFNIWPQTRIDIKYSPLEESLQADFPYVDLGEVLQFASFFKSKESDFTQLLQQVQPTGVINNLSILLDDYKSDLRFMVSGSMINLESKAWKKLPGVSGLDADFVVGKEYAKFDLPEQQVIFDYPVAFGESKSLEQLSGQLYAKFNKEELYLSGENISLFYEQANGNGSFKFSGNKKSSERLLDLAFFLEGGRVNLVDHYIPSKKMPKNTVDWLENSLRAGKVNHGSIMFYGDLKSFPFKQQDGVFNVNLDVEDGQLVFAESWPRIRKIDGVFDLNATAFTFNAKSAQTLGSNLENISVSFPNFFSKNKNLYIEGKATGPSRNKLRYLHNSPLEDWFAKHIKPIKMSGDSDLELQLDIPLTNMHETKVNGILNVKKNNLTAREWQVDVRDLTTTLRFDEQSIWADSVVGKMGPTALNGKIETLHEEDEFTIVISNDSQVSHLGLEYALGNFIDKAHWSKFLKGETQLQTKLNIPISKKKGGKSAPISLTIQSDLDGMAVNFPAPFKKNTQDARQFNLFTELSGATRRLKIDYGDTHSIFEIVATNNEQHISRGNVAFAQKAELPTEHGYRYVGNIKNFSWSQWEPLIFPPEGEKELFEDGQSAASQYFNISINELELFGSHFNNTSIQASQGAQLWSVHFSGPDASGEAFIPIKPHSLPLRFNMTRLYVKREETEQEDVVMDPRKMPAMNLNVKDFKYNDFTLGEMSLRASRIDSGLFLDEFILKNPDKHISAKGNWIQIANDQQSEFDIRISAKNLGNTLKSFGYADAIGGGKGDIDIQAKWRGKPSDFNVKIATGKVKIKIKDASLLDFELGAAKMFGLLLPRRLLLDFRDVFTSGMRFDSIKGEYSIENGNAFTSALDLEGAIADIHLAGRIGLVDQDYDQVVTINQHLVSDSLPIVAAIANPLIGAQVYVMKKLLEKQIDDILSIQYTLEGSWEDPKITPVSKVDNRELVDDILNEQ